MAKRFRTTMTHQSGSDPATVLQGRVVGINLVNWTVNVNCTFDRKKFMDVQVSSPYLHSNNGEGLSIFPEVGATCFICIPGDSSPPFILSFVMPHELVEGSSDDAPNGTRSHGAPPQNATDASFAGGRPKAKPGDIFLRTRDGNFVILHRGGVLSIGSTELSQRMYIPLNNLVRDISENYEHFNAGGAVVWGIQDGPSLTNFPAQHLQTFRVFANDRYADIRVARGKVFSPTPEPDGGVKMAAAGVGVGTENPIIYELVVSPKGFVAESGEPANATAVKSSVLRFTFDRTGNVLFRCEGNISLQVKKRLVLDTTQDIAVTSATSIAVGAKSGIDVDGGAYTHIKGKIVRLGPGKIANARLGDVTQSYIPPSPAYFVPAISGPLAAGVPIPGVFSLSPAPGAPLVAIGGSITTAEPTVLT